MFESIKALAKKHPCITATVSILAIAGLSYLGYQHWNNRNLPITMDNLPDTLHPEASKDDKQIDALADVVKDLIPHVTEAAESTPFEIDDIISSFLRSGHIRHLHEGQLASAGKIAQAAAEGIYLNPGETIVNACTVTRHAHNNN